MDELYTQVNKIRSVKYFFLKLFLFIVLISLLVIIPGVKAQTPVIKYDVGVYWNAACTDSVISIDWGTLYPGSVTHRVVYMRNEGDVGFKLHMTTQNWNPPEAANYIHLTSDYNGQVVYPNEVIQVTLTLSVDQDIGGIIDFSFDMIISMKPYDTDVEPRYSTGLNPFVKGTCVDYQGEHTDECWGNAILREYYIEDYKCEDYYYDCSRHWWDADLDTKYCCADRCEFGELGCYSGSRGCIIACQRIGYAFGYCEPQDVMFYWFQDPRCRENECYCYCAGAGGEAESYGIYRSVSLSLFTNAVIVIVIVTVIMVIVYGILKITAKKK